MTITVANNADLDVAITFKHSADGQPFDLRGVDRLAMHVRREVSDIAAALHLSTDGGGLSIEDAVNGVIRASKKWTEVQHLAGTFEFDIIAITDDRRVALYRDQIVFIEGVTRA